MSSFILSKNSPVKCHRGCCCYDYHSNAFETIFFHFYVMTTSRWNLIISQRPHLHSHILKALCVCVCVHDGQRFFTCGCSANVLVFFLSWDQIKLLNLWFLSELKVFVKFVHLLTYQLSSDYHSTSHIKPHYWPFFNIKIIPILSLSSFCGWWLSEASGGRTKNEIFAICQRMKCEMTEAIKIIPSH